MNASLTQEVLRRLEGASGLWLFLDYDGTLAEFAPTPDTVVPDRAVIRLIKRLVDGRLEGNGRQPVRVAVISGRRLAHIRTLLPVPGILLAGTYGIEIHHPEAGDLLQLEQDEMKPVLDAVRPLWMKMIAGREGFYLEDKGWALALHARFASDEEAETVLGMAKGILDHLASGTNFRVLGGSKFLEVGPVLANKGVTVEYLMNRFEWQGSLPVFIGDDDKDEEAFIVIKKHHGIPVVVSARERPTQAAFRLESPRQVRAWLEQIIPRLHN